MISSMNKTIFLVVLAACLSGSSEAAAERTAKGKPILVGGTLSLTGKYDEMGRMQEKGYRLWETEINQAGGLLGRPVRLLIIDDGSSAKKGRNPGKISIVFLDLMMPVMDGRKAFEGIREIDPDARIVISTGFSGDQDVDKLKELGASAILPKPYSYSTLTSVVSLLESR